MLPDEPYPPGVPLDLGYGLVLRAVADEHDVERVTRFNADIHDSAGEEYSRWLLGGSHPTAVWSDCLLVEDTATGAVVSSLALVPRTWTYDGIPLRVGTVEMVGTHPGYHHRGLVAAQMRVFDQMLRVRQCHLSALAGIPYFYRQFGYEYALPLDGGWRLAPEQIPPLVEGQSEPVVLRPLDPDSDLPMAMSLHDKQASALCIASVRSEHLWRHLLRLSTTLTETYAVVDSRREMVGYYRLEPVPWEDSLHLREAALRPGAQRREVLLAILRHAASRLSAHGCRKVGVPLWDDHPAAVLAGYLGAEFARRYAWQIRLPDEAAFLRHISPALERRLAASMLAGFSGRLDLNLMRRLLSLRFTDGRSVAVDDLGYQQSAWMARFAPGIVNMLLLGDRSRDEICAWYPDAHVRPEARHLVDVLFPKTISYVLAL